MHLDIAYGKEKVPLEIPDDRVAAVVHPNEVQKRDAESVLNEAMSNTVNSKSFADFLSDARDVLFIVNDATRPTPTAKVLSIIHDRIKNVPFKFIIATGIHRAPTEDELQFIFGPLYEVFKDRIYVHDARRDEDMVHIGTSRNGTEMYVNKMGMNAHKIVLIGSVEPHYFGGYTGGRKSFLPGIASFKTIEQNHKYALKPESKSLALEGNPVHEDMIDALKTIEDKEVFSIQTVLDRDRDIYAATAGHIHDSFYAAIESAKKVFCVPIREKTDVVVSVAPYPMDVDLYQSQKAIDNGKLALNEDGVLIMVSKCRTGIGEKAFYDLLSSCQTPREVLEKIGSEYKLGWHKAGKMAEVMAMAQVWGVTDLACDDLEKIFIRSFDSVQEAVDRALEEKGSTAKVTILVEGSITVPMLEG
jgi:nickel-dependent lactate racemase